VTSRFIALAAVAVAITACRDSALARSTPDTLGTRTAAEARPSADTIVPPDGGFVVRSVTDSGRSYAYQVFVPRGFDRARRWPVVLFLAGSGAIGTDNVKQTVAELGAVIRARPSTFPALAVFPQSPPGEHGVGRVIFKRLAMRALEQTVREFSGDSTRIYLTGYSYGASVGYDLALEHRATFAAFVPVAGMLITPLMPGGVGRREPPTERELAPLRTLPMWVFHGRNDSSIPVAGARSTVAILRSLGAPVRYTEFSDADHGNVAGLAFATPELYTWLWAQRIRS
jgi:predicted peptidase